jgi:hypothetical protein
VLLAQPDLGGQLDRHARAGLSGQLGIPQGPQLIAAIGGRRRR